MGRIEYLAMKTSNEVEAEAASMKTLESDLRDLQVATRKLAKHVFKLNGAGSLSFATTFLKFMASFAAMSVFSHLNLLPYLLLSLSFVISSSNLISSALSIFIRYLLVLDRTNWRTNMLTSLLVPYIFLSFPSSLFSLLRYVVTISTE